MGVVILAYNSTTGSADIRATIQQVNATTGALGDFWQESSTSFVTIAAQTFTQRSYTVTEQLPLGSAAMRYYSSTPGSGMIYTGILAVGYHDAGSSDEPLFTEFKYYQAGNDVSFTIADDRVNTPVADAFVFKMGRRADRSIVATNDVFVSSVDVERVAFDITDLVPPGGIVSTTDTIAVSPTGAMTATLAGRRDAQSVLWVSGQTAGVSYDLSCNVLTNNGATLQLNGKVVTLTTP